MIYDALCHKIECDCISVCNEQGHYCAYGKNCCLGCIHISKIVPCVSLSKLWEVKNILCLAIDKVSIEEIKKHIMLRKLGVQ